MKITTLFSIILCLCMSSNLFADTFYVDVENGDDGWNGRAAVYDPYTGDGPKQTIGGGVSVANDDDLVMVADGMYMGSNNYGSSVINKGLTIRSANGPDNCIINTGGYNVPFVFSSAYYSGSFVMDGFTIMNAREIVMRFTLSGGYPPEIKNCVIRDCVVQEAAVRFENSAQATLNGCSFFDIYGQDSYNTISNILCMNDSVVSILNCYIEGPRQDSDPYSAGVRCRDNAQATINGSTITQSWGKGIVLERGVTCSVENSEISDSWAGGILCEDADEWNPTQLNVTGCEITGNWGSNGAAIKIDRDVNAVVTDCNITENWTYYGGTTSPIEYLCVVGNAYGALKLERCNIMDNWTDSYSRVPPSAVMVISPNSVQITDCDIRHNDNLIGVYLSGFYGGDVGNSLISNTVVAYNMVGIMVGYLPALVSNCTIVANGYGGAPTPSTGVIVSSMEPNSVEILNSIVYGNSSFWQIYSQIPGSLLVNYCDVGSIGPFGVIGTGNIDVDPNFADSYYDDYNDVIVFGEDFHLISIAGRYDPVSDSWVHDANTSPCVDAGDPNSDYSLEPDPSGTGINMGAYGGTIYASRSPYGPRPYCSNYVKADLNMDCRVDLADFAEMAAAWLDCYLVPASACDE